MEPCVRAGLAERLMARSSTVGRHFERSADLQHSGVAEATEPLDEEPDGNRFDRVEVDGTSMSHRVIHRVEHDLAGEPANGRCARSDQGTSKSSASLAAERARRASSSSPWSTVVLRRVLAMP